MRQKTAAALAATAMLAALGCGASRPKSDADQVRAVDTTFAKALAVADYGKACSLMTSQAKTQVVGFTARLHPSRGCAGAVEVFSGMMTAVDKAALQHYTVVSIKVTGNTAMVFDNSSTPTHLRKVGDEWFVDWDTGSNS